MILNADLLWDSCVLLNVTSTDRITDIVAVMPGSTYICAEVQRESLYLVADDGTDDVVEVDLNIHFGAGLLKPCDIAGEVEAGLLVGLSPMLDDGEANTLAIAISRGWGVATDDRKARRIFLENNADEELLVSTSDIIRHWAEVTNASDDDVRKVLFRIERQARFFPPKTDPNLTWWTDLTR